MNSAIRNRFILKSAIVFIVASALCFFIYQNFSKPTQWYILLLPAFTFILNLFSFYIASTKPAQKNFNIQISLLFGIKFFSYLLLCLFFFIKEAATSLRLLFISIIFALYIINTIVLLTDITKFYKSASNS